MNQLQNDVNKASVRGRGSSSAGSQQVDVSHVPPAHQEKLRANPSLASEFDRIYGAGASEAILYPGGGGGGAKKKGKKPKPEHIQMLLDNPDLVGKFDKIYGEGAGEELLRRTGHGQEEAPASAGEIIGRVVLQL